MPKTSFFWLMLFMTLISTASLWSQEMATYNIHQEYVSPRAMGMGGAFTAIADDYSAIFYNPATLALREDRNFNFTLAQVGTTTGENSFYDLYQDIDKASNVEPKSEATNEMARLIESKYGNRYYARISALPMLYAGKGIGWAIIPDDLTLNLDVHNNIGPTLNVVAYLDSTVAFAYARKIEQVEGLAVGATAKVVHRGYFGKSMPAVELATNNNFIKASDANEGATLDFDIGSIYNIPVTLPLDMKASAALVIRNLLDYGFKKNFHLIDKNSGEPVKLQRRLDIGSVLRFPKLLVFDPTVSVDIRDIGHPNWRFRKGYHLGTEWKWPLHRWLQAGVSAGINQGYYSLGIGVTALVFRFDVVTYGEEVGTSNKSEENRITMAKLSLDF